MQQVTGALDQGSKAVIDSDDQYEVSGRLLLFHPILTGSAGL